ncbi:metallophosphoesterase [Litoribacter ruber]|uniref:Metallophosphoesterase n=1 Tax=Litoribacter ruber TaxID=702568 RepID=A0AAP2CI76_9BACT|nr:MULTISPECIES: metallophosphoesterase [Litoribacter]MBS9523050.1 metallophosphoesterase [Litoribacter alkaliphilus]MBT0810786.1 metallophosphoesterase [Litoribacter ruber]
MNGIGSIIFIIVFTLLSTFINWYVFQGLKTLVEDWGSNSKKSFFLGYWIIFGGITLFSVITFIRIAVEGKIPPSAHNLVNVILTVTGTQIVFILFMLGEDLVRSMVMGAKYVTSDEASLPSRRKFVTQLGLVVAAIPFSGFIYGIFKGKYNFKVHHQPVYYSDLPEEFDGFKIVQLSDIHSGSFKDFGSVERGIQMVIDQEPDLFVFTGDLVNHRAGEIDPFLEKFSTIKGKHGQFSILGNHDYGDYIPWPTPQEKKDNFNRMIEQHGKLGYKLLMNENITVKKGNSSIRLLGVENWGIGFNKKGDLDKALDGVDKNEFKVLLSHDPSHWEEVVKDHPSNIHLTLSGHTHGMQFGIETPVIRWSPAQYRYPHWAGLAQSLNRYLYVNRGFGFHAFSGRVGIWPEITVIELKKQQV